MNDLLSDFQSAWQKIKSKEIQEFEKLGLKPAEARLLLVVSDAKKRGIGLSELAEKLPTEYKPSKLVDDMVERQLLKREIAKGDRRRVTITVTSRSSEMVKLSRKARSEIRKAIRKALGQYDTESVCNVLKELHSL